VISSRKIPVFIVALAVILRITALSLLGPVDSAGGDFALYDRMAKNLIAEGDFGGEPEKTLGSPNINPGLALWLALLYLLFGFNPLVPAIGQIFLGVLLTYGTYLFASYIFNKNTGILAAFLVAIFPPLIILTVEPYNAVLYSVVFLFSLFFFMKGIYEDKLYYAVLSGIFLGLAVLNESIAFYLPIIFGIWLVFIALKKIINYKKAAALFTIFILAFAGTLAPWAIRNITIAKGEVRIVSKGELQLVTPGIVSDISAFVDARLIASGLKRMFLFPYGIWRLDDGSTSYKELPGKIIRGENLPMGVLLNLAIKIISTVFYWALLLLSIYSAFKFRTYGTLLFLLLIYTTAASIGYVAYQHGNFDAVAYLSVFIVPLFPMFAVLTSGLFISKIRGKQNAEPV
jgi:4-amino-4-deoxy-L-arabinose transferase-like glycosyltransferase